MYYLHSVKNPEIYSLHAFHSVEKREILSHKKKKRKNRQINSLAISLVKPLLSRNFCQKNVRVNFRNFHTVRLKYKRTILRENDIQCKVQSVAFTEFLQ